jgi:hypothetical protein
LDKNSCEEKKIYMSNCTTCTHWDTNVWIPNIRKKSSSECPAKTFEACTTLKLWRDSRVLRSSLLFNQNISKVKGSLLSHLDLSMYEASREMLLTGVFFKLAKLPFTRTDYHSWLKIRITGSGTKR